MSHLDTERLAMLADDEPSAAERVHLRECEWCAREWRGYLALREMAMRAPNETTMKPLTTWETLAEQMREEGLLRPGTSPARRGGGWMRGWMQIAAGLLIMAGGVALGRVSAASSGSEQQVAGSVQRGAGDSQNVGRLGVADSSFTSVEDARAVMDAAERQYRLASLWLLERQDESDPESNPDLYRTRLAALDQMAGAAREAVYEAPHDPVINSYYLNTLAAREVTLKQLNASLKDGMVRRF